MASCTIARNQQLFDLYKAGRSSYRLASDFGLAQSSICAIVRKMGHLPKPYHRANKTIDNNEPEPYRILDDAVRKLFSERHYRPASQLRIGGIIRG